MSLPAPPSQYHLSPPTTDPGIPPPHSTNSFWHQSPSSFLHNHRTTQELPQNADIVIIGSGISGAMTAHFLHEQYMAAGLVLPKVVMLEARQACWGATGRNGGHCKPAVYAACNFDELYSHMGHEQFLKMATFQQLNLDLIASYVNKNGVECDFRITPSCDSYFNQASFDLARGSIAAMAKVLPEIAAKLEVVTPDTEEGRRKLESVARTPTALGAVLFTAGSLWPYKLVAYILEKAIKEYELNLQTLTPALSVLRTSPEVGEVKPGEWTVTTPRGAIAADKVIFATNAHTSHLLPAFRGRIFPVRGQMAALRPPLSLLENPLTHTYGLVRRDRQAAEYLVQRPVTYSKNRHGESVAHGGELMLGGARFLARNRGEGHMDGSIDLPVAEYLRECIADYFPDETGYNGEKEREKRIEKSLVSKFRKLSIGKMGDKFNRFWDPAEGFGDFDYEEEDESLKPQPKPRICRPKYEWTGVMGYSSDQLPWVGRVPELSENEAREKDLPFVDTVLDTDGLWMLAGFEGHGMAYCTGSAKALAQMITPASREKQESVYQWFPRTFATSRERLGLQGAPEKEDWVDAEEEPEWVVV